MVTRSKAPGGKWHHGHRAFSPQQDCTDPATMPVTSHHTPRQSTLLSHTGVVADVASADRDHARVGCLGNKKLTVRSGQIADEFRPIFKREIAASA